MLAREVLRLRGTIGRGPNDFSVIPDMFFYRDEAEIAAETAEAKALASAEQGGTAEIGGAEAQAVGSDWEIANTGSGGAAAAAAAALGSGAAGDAGLDWAADTGNTNWAADDQAGQQTQQQAPATTGWE